MSDRDEQLISDYSRIFFSHSSAPTFHNFNDFSRQQDPDSTQFECFDPLLQDTPFDTSHSSYSTYHSPAHGSPISQYALPLDASDPVSASSDSQTWPQRVPTGVQTDPLHLDTQFDLANTEPPFSTYGSYQIDNASLGVGKSFPLYYSSASQACTLQCGVFILERAPTSMQNAMLTSKC